MDAKVLAISKKVQTMRSNRKKTDVGAPFKYKKPDTDGAPTAAKKDVVPPAPPTRQTTKVEPQANKPIGGGSKGPLGGMNPVSPKITTAPAAPKKEVTKMASPMINPIAAKIAAMRAGGAPPMAPPGAPPMAGPPPSAGPAGPPNPVQAVQAAAVLMAKALQILSTLIPKGPGAGAPPAGPPPGGPPPGM